SMNHGLMIARSIAWKAPTNVRSSVFLRPGMMVWEERAMTPAARPVRTVAAVSMAWVSAGAPLAGATALTVGCRRVWMCSLVPLEICAGVVAGCCLLETPGDAVALECESPGQAAERGGRGDG